MFGIKTNSLFGETKKLEREIDEFVDILSEVGLVFKNIIPTAVNLDRYKLNIMLLKFSGISVFRSNGIDCIAISEH